MIDVSGSVSESELKLIYSHVKEFNKKHQDDVRMDLFFWSSGEIKPERDLIKNVKENNLVSEPYTYYGTDLSYVCDFLKKEYEGKEIIFINITDTYFRAEDLPAEIVKKHYVVCTAQGREEDTLNDFKNRTVPIDNIVTLRAERSEF